jgi:hypothetical protein
MKIDFGQGSYAQTEPQSWLMRYLWPPPFVRRYRDEPGVHIHLAPADAKTPRQAIGAAADAVDSALAPVLDALATVLPSLARRMPRSRDGALDIRFSEHGFQVAGFPAGDPNVWINGAWRPVTFALNQLASVE